MAARALTLPRLLALLLLLVGATSLLVQVVVIGYSHQWVPPPLSSRYEVVLGEGITGGLVFLLAATATLAFLPALGSSTSRQAVVVVALVVACTMAAALATLSTLRVVAVHHDPYYLHHGLTGVMVGLYSTLLLCGLLAGIASLTLLTLTCLLLPLCTSHQVPLTP